MIFGPNHNRLLCDSRADWDLEGAINNYLLAESAADEKPMTDLMKLQNMGLENDEEVCFSPLSDSCSTFFAHLRLNFGGGSGDLTQLLLISAQCSLLSLTDVW